MGAALALGGLTPETVLRGLVFLVGSLCLVAHVFVLNDWAGIQGDLRDPLRRDRTFVARGGTRAGMGALALVLVLPCVLAFTWLGWQSLVLATAILGVSALYSAPGLHMKGRPVLGSLLHLGGGTLHFLLGHAAFAPVTAAGVATGLFFGLTFAAGHLMHETRGHEGDLFNGIRTNAVVFGKAWTFFASCLLFTAAYALLGALVHAGQLPSLLWLALAFFPVHLFATCRALYARLDMASLLRLQACYRLLYALTGLLMLVGAAQGWTSHWPWPMIDTTHHA
jgi:4-hydroxybenzoate polyprenyltransferase